MDESKIICSFGSRIIRCAILNEKDGQIYANMTGGVINQNFFLKVDFNSGVYDVQTSTEKFPFNLANYNSKYNCFITLQMNTILLYSIDCNSVTSYEGSASLCFRGWQDNQAVLSSIDYPLYFLFNVQTGVLTKTDAFQLENHTFYKADGDYTFWLFDCMTVIKKGDKVIKTTPVVDHDYQVLNGRLIQSAGINRNVYKIDDILIRTDLTIFAITSMGQILATNKEDIHLFKKKTRPTFRFSQCWNSFRFLKLLKKLQMRKKSILYSIILLMASQYSPRQLEQIKSIRSFKQIVKEFFPDVILHEKEIK